MNARTINLLLQYLPPDLDARPVNHYRSAVESEFDDPEIARFIRAYSDLSIGWKCARQLAEADMSFPSFIEGNDLWLFRAYLFCLNPDKYRDKHISHARAIASTRMRDTRDAINGLLMCEDATYAVIERDTSVPKETIAAYEKLFYNVMDRHLDHLFIRNIAYPSGRLVETYEDYLENEELGKILLRIGFNNGRDDVLHFAGFRSGLLGSLAQQNMPEKLESVIMANGYLLARNGWANQREHAAGLSSARNLIAAAKHGGQLEQQGSAFTEFGATLIEEILTQKKEERASRPILADIISEM
jgi:hypothetical protein